MRVAASDAGCSLAGISRFGTLQRLVLSADIILNVQPQEHPPVMDLPAENAETGKPDYGLDSPGLVRMLLWGGGLALLFGFAVRVPEDLFFLQAPLASLQLGGAFALVQAALLAASSFSGKLKERDRLIGSLTWRGDEQVLDAGCGRGLLLIAAAKRLTTGTAHGIDVWRSEDLTDNWAEATRQNARLEGVEDRVAVHDADMREMPFEANRFDRVLCSLVFYLFPSRTHRRKAMEEIFRVLKPGGDAHLLEIGWTPTLESLMKEAGFENVKRSGFRLRIFPPARIVSGCKPRTGADTPALSAALPETRL